MSLVLYGAPLSPFVRKADVVLREKNVPFELESVNIMPMPDWFKEISPARRIPVLRDKSVGEEGTQGTIPDSSAICAYLERKFPEPALYPSDPYLHGRAVWIEEFCDSELAGLVGMEQAARIAATRLRLVEARGGEDLAGLCRRSHSSWNPLRTAVYNGLDSSHRFAGGELVKIARREDAGS